MKQHLKIYFMFFVIINAQASLFGRTSEARVVLPARANSFGYVVSNDLTFNPEETTLSDNRRKRQTSNSKRGSSNHEDPEEKEKLYVVIHDNDEEEILLQLTPNTKLVSPMTVIEWFYEGGRHVVRRMDENCFYSGRDVRAKGYSLVAVSNCDGLVGYIQTNNESYFIEPLTKELRSKLLQPSTPDFGDDEDARTQYQEQRRRISRYEQLQRIEETANGGPRPHVIYKVNSVIDKLNLSIDQDFEMPLKSPSKEFAKKNSWDSFQEVFPNDSKNNVPKKYHDENSRFKRSLDEVESKFLKGGRRTYPQKRNSEMETKNNNSYNTKSSNKKKNQRSNKGGKRKKRNNCKKISSKIQNFSAAKNESENLERFSIEDKDEKCLTKREKREKRREMKEKRRIEREKRKREKEEKRKQRERKKKKKAKKHKFSNAIQHTTLTDPLEHEEWQGYSPDLLWETQVAPGHSGLTEFDYGTLLNGTDPPKWLELTVGIDHTVIDFHGEDHVEKYVLTLFNIVSAIYEDPSLQANLDIVLLRLIFYKDKSQSRVKEGLAKSSLQAVNRWAETLFRLSSRHLQHDLAVWLTRLDLGGPSGYAPVSGVCDPSRSCTLNRDEGLTSAFIIAHEMGHVLGLSHDGDTTADNTCEPEGRLGSVMAPLVAATFGRFHWSRCSTKEYHSTARTWECLLNEPQWEQATLMSASIRFQYSLDDQCRMEFGEGFGLCRTFGMSDPCTFLWCSNSSTPHLCKTKKGPPLEGTICADKMWCRHGFCEPIRDSDLETEETDEIKPKKGPPIRHNPQNGGWSYWSDWGPCSRTCGTGIMFRTRECDSPIPRWGGRLCQGKREEWKVCSTDPCSDPGDLRAQQCHLLSHLVKLGKRRSKLKWLPYESKRRRKKCRMTCVSRRTREMYIGKEYLVDGTPCSYDDPHSVCVQGKCVAMGCDSVVGSRVRLDDCGVCGGSGSSCRRNTFHFTDIPGTDYMEVVVIPKGAWKIAVRENPSTTNFISLRDNSSELVFNPSKRQEAGRDFISEGTLFHYIRKGEKESLLARGPLIRPVTIMVHGGAVREEVTITTTFLSRENPWDFFKWEIGPLTACSATCGGGNQKETLYCKDLRSNSKVNESLCEHLKQLHLRSYPCNHFGCEVRWLTGPWEHCTATCGSQGMQHRQVSCVNVNRNKSKKAKAGQRDIEELIGNEMDYEEGGKELDSIKSDFNRDSLKSNAGSSDSEESITVIEPSEISIQTEPPNHINWKKDLQNLDFEIGKIEHGSMKMGFPTIGLDYMDPMFCRGEREPYNERSCNRIPCPVHWEPQGWTECSVTCGMGQQEIIFICSGKNDVGNVGGHNCGRRPREVRACFVGNCEHQSKESETCTKDDSAFCQLPTLHRYCKIPKYYQLCCHTCFKVLNKKI